VREGTIELTSTLFVLTDPDYPPSGEATSWFSDLSTGESQLGGLGLVRRSYAFSRAGHGVESSPPG
jgi:hypothetical protein